jgi:hypothetical protein
MRINNQNLGPIPRFYMNRMLHGSKPFGETYRVKRKDSHREIRRSGRAPLDRKPPLPSKQSGSLSNHQSQTIGRFP